MLTHARPGEATWLSCQGNQALFSEFAVQVPLFLLPKEDHGVPARLRGGCVGAVSASASNSVHATTHVVALLSLARHTASMSELPLDSNEAWYCRKETSWMGLIVMNRSPQCPRFNLGITHRCSLQTCAVTPSGPERHHTLPPCVGHA